MKNSLLILYSVIILFGLIAFSSCIASEFTKSKVKDLKIDGKLCRLPQSPAFVLGIIACICLCTSHITGNVMIFILFFSKGNKIVGALQRVPIILLLLSWISFGFAIIVLGSATSMNYLQGYGEGWIDGECYLVKDGVYIGMAVLSLASVGLMLGSILTRMNQRNKE